MDLSLVQSLLGGASGSLVGFTLGLVGGGGSILAVPLLVYLVGVPSTHVAIGTSAVAVAVNAAAGVIGHARAGNVRWPCASDFASGRRRRCLCGIGHRATCDDRGGGIDAAAAR